MAAAWYQALADLRLRRRATIALALAIGVATAVALGAFAGARRADTALGRWLRVSGASDVGVFDPALRPDAVARLPMVEAVGESVYAGINFPDVAVEERELIVPFAAGDDDQYRFVDRPKIVSGRISDPSRATEVMVSEALAKRRDVRPGSRLKAQPFTAVELAEAQSGEHEGPYVGPFVGPVLQLRIVGVVRTPTDLSLSTDEAESGFVGGSEQLYLTPAFHRAYTHDQIGFTGLNVRLRGGERDVPRFLAAAERLAGNRLEDFIVSAPGARKAQRAIHIEAFALFLFAAFVGGAVVAVFGQTLSRDVSLESDHVSALRAVGMTRWQRAAVGILRASVIVAAAMVVGAVVAAIASVWFPIGIGRLAEAKEGFDVDLTALLGGASAVAALLLLVVAGAAWRAADADRLVPTAIASGRGPWLPAALARIGAPLPAVLGARLAVTPGRGKSATPVVSTVGGLVISMAALSSAAIFGASLDRLVDTPRLQGWAWDVHARADDGMAFDAVRALATEVSTDRDISELAVTTGVLSVQVQRVGGDGDSQEAATFGIDAVQGSIFPPLHSGRPPSDADEIVLPPRLADRLHVRVGGRVRVESEGASAVFRVVGTAVFPDTLLAAADLQGGYGMLVSVAGSQTLDEGERGGGGILARLAPDANRAAVEKRLEKQVGALIDFRHAPEVRNLSRARWTPTVLGAVLAALGVATLVHLLVTAVRRRRRDLAVLKSFGVRRRSIAAVVAWQATTLISLSLLLSAPFGIVGGRWMWNVVATSLGAVPQPWVPVVPIASAALGALLLGNAVAALPGRAAARLSVAEVLRAE